MDFIFFLIWGKMFLVVLGLVVLNVYVCVLGILFCVVFSFIVFCDNNVIW